ncbi:hypothetical protein [Ancylomarina sp.]|uniref:hypothetical protein n=1 Tax=Ancylomarina sp. TaxID=1970196 RepID=UPI003563BF8F
MAKLSSKPSPEAKALSLFLMAYKSTDPVCKEKSKRINKRWTMVLSDEISRADYNEEVQEMLTAYGGYEEVVEKTVKFYIEKTGEWTLKGNDKYCQDAQVVADKLLKK